MTGIVICDTFRESFKVLPSKGRISIIAPIFSTIDGGDVQLNVEKMANFYKFKLVPMLNLDRTSVIKL